MLTDAGKAGQRRRDARFYAKRRDQMHALKNVPCMDCEQTFPPYVMDFDHARGDKVFEIGSRLTSRSWDAILVEAIKCDVVCANCHRIRTAERRENGN